MTGLVKKIDQRVGAAGKSPRTIGAYVIFIDNAEGLDKKIRETAEKEGIKHAAFGIGDVPNSYAVAKEADVTVVVYNPGRRNKQNVKANFALRQGELTDAKVDDIVKAISDVLPR